MRLPGPDNDAKCCVNVHGATVLTFCGVPIETNGKVKDTRCQGSYHLLTLFVYADAEALDHSERSDLLQMICL